jgi:hypothetical protein
MINKNLIKALQKNGVNNIDINSHGLHSCNAPNGRYVLEWYVQDNRAICCRVRSITDHDDLMTDYHAGTFHDTIKSIIHWLCSKNPYNTSY